MNETERQQSIENLKAKLANIAAERDTILFKSMGPQPYVKIVTSSSYLSRETLPAVMEFKKSYSFEIMVGIIFTLCIVSFAFVTDILFAFVLLLIPAYGIYRHTKRQTHRVILDNHGLTIDGNYYEWPGIMELFEMGYCENRNSIRLLIIAPLSGEYKEFDISDSVYNNLPLYAATYFAKSKLRL